MPGKSKLIICIILILVAVVFIFRRNLSLIANAPAKGTPIDSFNGVMVYYNGPVSNVSGRHVAKDGYNLGLKYQCVEFVKRYYYEYYHHKMPDTYGHAVSFFDTTLKDGAYNIKRDLYQYRNPGLSKPRSGDLLIFTGTDGNPYGHVAIVCRVDASVIEVIQQNPGIGAPSRVNFDLGNNGKISRIHHDRILGWLRKK
jgi:hypothetical protein